MKKRFNIVRYLSFRLLTLFALLISAVFFINQLIVGQSLAADRANFGTGYYINLAGAKEDPNGFVGQYGAEADCNSAQGYCRARNRYTGQDYTNGNVQKYICNGKVTQCDKTHNPGKVIAGPFYSTIHYLTDASHPAIVCNQTIQLDVFDGQNKLKGFMNKKRPRPFGSGS